MNFYLKAFIHGCSKVITQPRLSLPVVLTLGLTLSAVLAVSAITSLLLLKPLTGIKAENELYAYKFNIKISAALNLSYWNMRRLADINQYFKQVGEFAGISASKQDIDVSKNKITTTVYTASDNSLKVLGSQLILGQLPSSTQIKDKVWISESLWRQSFMAQESVLNKSITLNGNEYHIMGVIEDVYGIKSKQTLLPLQLWRFHSLQLLLQKDINAGSIRNELSQLIIRTQDPDLIPNKTQTLAWFDDYIARSAITDDTSSDAMQNFKDSIRKKELTVTAENYRKNFIGDNYPLLISLLIAVLGLLVMAILNLLNLFIAHYQSRSKEFAIQLTLGASLHRLKFMLWCENLPAMCLASIIGLLTATWLLKALPMLAGDNLPMTEQVLIDINAILLAFISIAVINSIFVLLGLLQVNKSALQENLNSSGKGSQAQNKQGLTQAIMVGQITLASILLSASVMLAIQSYQAVYQDLGYQLGNQYRLTLAYKDKAYQQQLALKKDEAYHGSELESLHHRLTRYIQQQAPNSQLIIAAEAPLATSFLISIEFINEQDFMYQVNSLSATFFSHFNIPILAGANLTQAQIDNNAPLVIIDERAAKQLFPNKSLSQIIGESLPFEDKKKFTIAAVVANTHTVAGSITPMNFPTVYYSQLEAGDEISMIFALPQGQSLTAAVLAEISTQFPQLGNAEIKSMADLWLKQTSEQRLAMWLVITITILTVLLAAIGLSGLTQMNCQQRTYELAVRMATGASQARLLTLVLKSTGLMLVLGLGLGIICSVALYTQVQPILDILPPLNAGIMLFLNVALTVIVILSVIFPAWKIIKADPMQSLRQE